MRALRTALLLGLAAMAMACSMTADARKASSPPPRATTDPAQVPRWSTGDLEFFLHGSMGSEVIPERVLRAFIVTYPDLFPRADLANFGLLPDPDFGWPVGLSRREVPHLGGLSSLGINCASCHVGDVVSRNGGAPVRILGMTSLFDVEAFFGAVTVATFRTAQPASMRRFLSAYLAAGSGGGDAAGEQLAREWRRQEERVLRAIAEDPLGAKDVIPGGLHRIDGRDLRLDASMLAPRTDGARRTDFARRTDLVLLVRAMLKLFHNMRASLHIPDEVPGTTPPPSGPGRNDAFGLLSAALFGLPQPYAPVKFGLVWDLQTRRWVHWDGNTEWPLGRNLLASLGLGAPLLGTRGLLDLATVERQTRLAESILSPKYPFEVDDAAARRGAPIFLARCASCHAGSESDRRLHDVDEIGTEPTRARSFTADQASRFNALLAGLEIPGYRPPSTPVVRSTGKYWAPSLGAVWARSPYLHNGSVRTMQDLLTPPSERATTFRRGSHVYDPAVLGYVDDGAYVLDTRAPGNGSGGHDYGTDLPAADKRDLIEYLKTH